jgi:alanine dehydrogenase
MKKGALIVDVSCDDAGCIETSKSTTHDDPTYYVDGIMHYVVDNIPSAFSRTASKMLSNSTMPYLLAITRKGLNQALKDDKHLRRGLSFYYGELTLEETAIKQGKTFVSPDEIIKRF